MSRRTLDELLGFIPWWTGLVLAGPVYLGILHGLPAAAPVLPALAGAARLAPAAATAVAALMVAWSLLGLARRRRGGRPVREAATLEAMQGLGWREFHGVVEEVFRRRGYTVSERNPASPDAGVDLTLHGHGGVYLVQCHHRPGRVGAGAVRGLLRVIAATGVSGAFIVTSGRFTDQAQRAALGRQMELVDGHDLMSWLAELREEAPAAEVHPHPAAGDVPPPEPTPRRAA